MALLIVGVVIVGDVAKTSEPLPVSSVIAVIRLALLGVARKVATPVPRPEIPVLTGSPVQLVRVPDVGVPRIGVTRVGDVANTREPLPVSSVTVAIRLALEGVAKKVATPAPKPAIPVETGRPVQLVRVPLVGVPRIGVTRVGLVANTSAPVPVSSVTAEIKFALEGVARNVATPVPSPEIPVDTGRPVQFVKVPEVGVPRIGVTSVGDVANTSAPLPVSSLIAVRSSAEVPVSVLVVKLMDLFVSVSVVSRPTRVVVAVGRVSVPVFDIVDMTGAVRVLFVRVCDAVRVTSVSEILGTVSVRAVAVVIPLSSN